MPWYWSDDVAQVLLADERINVETAIEMTNVPVAHRSEHDGIDEAARELAEEGEIPLAA